MSKRIPRLRSGYVGLGCVLIIALVHAACSTTYQPRRLGQVGMVILHAAPMYIKDGQKVPIGPFGGDLEGLVADRPVAAACAHKAHTQFVIGVPAYLTGVTGVLVGILALSGPAGWLVIGIGGLTAGTGLGFIGSGVTHTVDAVNIYNDAER